MVDACCVCVCAQGGMVLWCYGGCMQAAPGLSLLFVRLMLRLKALCCAVGLHNAVVHLHLPLAISIAIKPLVRKIQPPSG